MHEDVGSLKGRAPNFQQPPRESQWNRWSQAKIMIIWVSLFTGRLCWCFRTYALWNRQRWLLMLGIPAIGLESAIILFGSMNLRYLRIPPGLPQLCIAPPEKGIWSLMAWIVPFTLDTAMSSLALVRAMRVSRKLKAPLVRQLIRDGEMMLSLARFWL